MFVTEVGSSKRSAVVYRIFRRFILLGQNQYPYASTIALRFTSWIMEWHAEIIASAVDVQSMPRDKENQGQVEEAIQEVGRDRLSASSLGMK